MSYLALTHLLFRRAKVTEEQTPYLTLAQTRVPPQNRNKIVRSLKYPLHDHAIRLYRFGVTMELKTARNVNTILGNLQKMSLKLQINI